MNHIFIDTYFEAGSPLRWEQLEDDLVHLEMIHDHERFGPNKQMTYWNFKVHVPDASQWKSIRFQIGSIDSCWRGNVHPALGNKPITLVYSPDGLHWKTLAGHHPENKQLVLGFEVPIESACTQVARIVPYTQSDLRILLQEIGRSETVRVYDIGSTVEGRQLEMVELGDPHAVNQIFIRARAHPWETGGSWLLEGLMRRLASGGRDVDEILQRVCFNIFPMANKDGVYRGMSRFNIRGIDLNSNWSVNESCDPALAPENDALQRWFCERRAQNRLPKLAICIHNDSEGGLCLAKHPTDQGAYLQRMQKFHEILRTGTFAVERTHDHTHLGPGVFSTGVMERYGIDALVWELNADFSEGLNREPTHTDWEQLGADLIDAIDRYFHETT